jgi:hypothetical protein
VRAVLSAKTLDGPETPESTLEKIASGEKPLDLARLGAVYEAAVQLDRAEAVALVEDVLRAAGLPGSFVPDAAAEPASTSLLIESAEASVAMGEVQGTVLHAAAAGRFEEVRTAAHHAMRELADVVVIADRLEASSQFRLALARIR